MNSYFDNFKDYVNFQSTQICNQIKNELETTDNEIYEEIKKQKPRKYWIERTRERTIITMFGKVKYQRRIYRKIQNNKKGRCIIPLDIKKKIRKWKRYDQQIINRIIQRSEKSFASFNNLGTFDMTNVNKVQVHRAIKNSLKINYECKYKPKPNRLIYFNIDDTFVNLKVNNKAVKYRIRLIFIHQGKNQKNKFINPKIFSLMKITENRKNVPSKLDILIGKIIDLNKFRDKIIFCSDGAKEFRKACEQLNLKQNIDEFHVWKQLDRTFRSRVKNYSMIPQNKRRDLYYQIKFYLKSRNITSVFNQLNNLISTLTNDSQNREFILFLKNFYKYLKNNFKSILFWQSKEFYPTVTESYICEKVKSILGNKKKCFSLPVFQSLLSMRTNFLNISIS